MSVDLRTELTDCDAVTGWSGDGPVDVDNTAGFVYEGTNAITTQHTNTDEEIYTTTQTGGNSFPEDLSDHTVYMILKDNLLQTTANGGVQINLGDGSNRRGHGVGGNDDTGIQLDVFWNAYKFDTTTTPPYTNNYQGAAAPSYSAITQVGLGTVHLAKAQGNVDNIKLDRFSFHANGSYGLRINGGTSGTPETTADVAGDSITNGWGMVANPAGAQYSFHAPTEIGEPTANADVYFNATDEQWTLIGGAVGATHFPFRIVGNATDTIEVRFTNVSITNVGTRADWTIGDVNVDLIEFDNVSFTDCGVITFGTDGSDEINNTTFNNCDQIVLNGAFGIGMTINGGFDADGAMLLDTAGDSDNMEDVTFVSDGSGHAIIITATGTYDFNNWFFNGFSGTGVNAAVYNNSGGAVTINVTGGDTPTVREGAGSTTTVVSSVTITVNVTDENGPVEGAAVYLEADDTTVILNTETNALGVATGSYGGTTPKTLDADVSGVKYSSGPIPYVYFPLSGDVTATGYTANVLLSED